MPIVCREGSIPESRFVSERSIPRRVRRKDEKFIHDDASKGLTSAWMPLGAFVSVSSGINNARAIVVQEITARLRETGSIKCP